MGLPPRSSEGVPPRLAIWTPSAVLCSTLTKKQNKPEPIKSSNRSFRNKRGAPKTFLFYCLLFPYKANTLSAFEESSIAQNFEIDSRNNAFKQVLKQIAIHKAFRQQIYAIYKYVNSISIQFTESQQNIQIYCHVKQFCSSQRPPDTIFCHSLRLAAICDTCCQNNDCFLAAIATPRAWRSAFSVS